VTAVNQREPLRTHLHLRRKKREIGRMRVYWSLPATERYIDGAVPVRAPVRMSNITRCIRLTVRTN
jgi:hypothetical protein